MPIRWASKAAWRIFDKGTPFGTTGWPSHSSLCATIWPHPRVATQAGEFAGFPAKGRPFNIMAIDIDQFMDGKVVKTWHVEDWLSGLFQMGSLEK